MAEAADNAATVQATRQPQAIREFAPAATTLLFVLFCAQPGIGFMLLLAVPILLVWLVRMAWIAWRWPSRRRAQGIKLAALVAALLAYSLAHAWWQHASRMQADQVIDRVLAYRAAHGAWPDNLAQAGLDAPNLRRRWRVFYYSGDDGHRVMYAATFTLFDTYGYDLDHPAAGWTFHAD